MIRCAHAEPSPVRISTREREPRSFGTRQKAVRLSCPQFACVGARLSGRIRLYAFTVGPSSACRPGACSITPAMKLAASGLRPSGPPSSANALRPSCAVQREVQVEARAALVGERAPHEGREQALAHGDLLHGGLQHERTVGCVERVGVLHVDLVLRVHELVVGGERLQAELVAPEQHPQHDLARVGDGADGVDARELVDVAPQAAFAASGSRSRRKNSSSGATIGVRSRSA